MFKKICIILSFFLATTLLWVLNSSQSFAHSEVYAEVYSSTSLGKIVKVDRIGYLFYPFRNGASVVKDLSYDYNALLKDLDAEIIFTETVAEGNSIYAYSKKIKYKTIIKGKAVNLHIHVGHDNIKIGSPIIYGSF